MSNSSSEISVTQIGIAIAVSIAIYFAWSQWSESRQLDKEQRLLFVGNQYRAAIGRYYENSPGPIKQFPPRLEFLVADARFEPRTQYIGEMYADPVAEEGWGLVRSSDGGIMGIHSLSDDAPIKISDFDPENQHFAGKTKYAEWIFQYVPKKTAAASTPRRDRTVSQRDSAVLEAQTMSLPKPDAAVKIGNAEQVAIQNKPPTRMIRPLAGQIDIAAIQLGAGVPGIPNLAYETDRRRRVCIVNATRYASSCAHHPDSSGSQEAALECVVEAQQRYEQCSGIL